MKGPFFRQMVGGLCLIGIVLQGTFVLAQADSQAQAVDLVCLTGRPAIVEGESTSLQAWATTQQGEPLASPTSFSWKVSDGTVQGSGAAVRWNLSGVRLPTGELHKKVTATVRTTSTGLEDTTCSVEVFIGRQVQAEDQRSKDETRGGLRSARRYLLPNKTEEPGFGLYSYLLFPVPPGDDEEKARYLKTLESCLRMMQGVEEHLARHRRPSELNATHIPVTAVPKHHKDLEQWATSVLDLYDYATAQKLLDRLDNTYRRGPYLVSVVKQSLSNGATPAQLHVLQDFTGKVPELVSQFVDLFTYRAAQQRTWTEESLQSFRLNLRNLVAVAGKVGPGVANTVVTLVQAKPVL